MNNIINLQNANRSFGGKAWGLTNLLTMDIPVPKGFVISNRMIKKLTSNNNDKEVKQLLLFLNSLTYKLAVRSSALAEDGYNKSFAGIFSTILNVDNELKKVLEAITIVNDSATKELICNYDSNKPKMNIIVQEMIEPIISGVAFTEAIDFNGETVLLIEYVVGLADKLVSGEVIPVRIILKYDADKKIIPNKRKDISVLVPYLQKIIDEFDNPMDVEWCIDKNNNPYFVQARPITQTVFIHNSLGETDFWFKEFMYPLFRLTDPQAKIFKENAVLFLKNNSTYAYNTNNREVKSSRIGYAFFTNTKKLKLYVERVDNIKKRIKRTISDCNGINKLTNRKFKAKIYNIIKLLNDYSNVYTKTEPFMLSKIEENELKYGTLIKKLGEMRFNLRKESEPVFHLFYRLLQKEITRRFDVKVANLYFYTFFEFQQVFNNQKIDDSIIRERKKGYALICDKNIKTLLINNDYKSLFKAVTKSDSEGLFGNVAMPGSAKGIARVISHNKVNIGKEVNAFKEGEILVTEMTRPDTIVACHKASAIITDEGGITSHASIISRELGIPCIVGVKNATRLIKTGDLIEIENGSIYLSRSKNNK